MHVVEAWLDVLSRRGCGFVFTVVLFAVTFADWDGMLARDLSGSDGNCLRISFVRRFDVSPIDIVCKGTACFCDKTDLETQSGSFVGTNGFSGRPAFRT